MSSSASSDNPLFPIAVLIDELRHDDMQMRLQAVKQVTAIAVALGHERTRDELLPFLAESIDDEDEVLVALSEELGKFVDLVGGPSHTPRLLDLLGSLATVEESAVRDKAVESITAVAARMTADLVRDLLVPLVLTRLAKRDWFTARISACSLIPVLYSRLVEASIKTQLLTSFAALARDDTPMVRRGAASALPRLCASASADRRSIESELLPAFTILARDDQDSVRLCVAESCVAFGRTAEHRARAMEVLRELVRDRSWRVRYSVASRLHDLGAAMGAAVANTDIATALQTLLGDDEAEVRTAATMQLKPCAAQLRQDVVVSELLPRVKALASDTSEHVRAALASVIMALAVHLGSHRTTEHLLPLFLQLLKDDNPEVRLNIISNLESAREVVGIETLSHSLLPAIMRLAEDKQWRVRLAIIDYLPLLAQQLGEGVFLERLLPLSLQFLGDSVYSIREAATNNLRQLVDRFGPAFFTSHVLPGLHALQGSENYLLRMTALLALQTIAESKVLLVDLLHAHVVPSTLRLAADHVPNVRFKVAKVICAMAPRIIERGSATAELRRTMQTLAADPDRDVKFFAQRAMQALRMS